MCVCVRVWVHMRVSVRESGWREAMRKSVTDKERDGHTNAAHGRASRLVHSITRVAASHYTSLPSQFHSPRSFISPLCLTCGKSAMTTASTCTSMPRANRSVQTINGNVPVSSWVGNEQSVTELKMGATPFALQPPR